jgi:hypothetical protein
VSRYRKLETGTWSDARFVELSPAPPNAQTLWMYLLTGQRTTVFPGIVIAREAVIASDLGWPLYPDLLLPTPANGCRCLMDAWAEIADVGMAIADWVAGVIVLPRALMDRSGRPRETSRPGSQNTFRGWARSWPEIPQCELTANYLKMMREFAVGLDAIYARDSAELTDKSRRKPGRPRLKKSRHVTYLETYEDAFASALRSIAERSPTSPPTSRRHTRVPVPVPVSPDERGFTRAADSSLGSVSGSGSGSPKPPDPDPRPPVPAQIPSAVTPLLTRGFPLAKPKPAPPSVLAGESPVAGVLPAADAPGTADGATSATAEPAHARAGLVTPDPAAVARLELGNRAWAKLNAIRAEMAAEFAWRDVRPLHPMDPGRVELNERLRESGASGEESVFHVLAVAAAEARASSPPSVRWLTGSLFGAAQWRRCMGMRVADAAHGTGYGTARGSGVRSAKPTPAPERAGAAAALERERREAADREHRDLEAADSRNLTDADRAELAELAAKLGVPPVARPPSRDEPDDEVPDA